jgi:hypothetical protein
MLHPVGYCTHSNAISPAPLSLIRCHRLKFSEVAFESLGRILLVLYLHLDSSVASVINNRTHVTFNTVHFYLPYVNVTLWFYYVCTFYYVFISFSVKARPYLCVSVTYQVIDGVHYTAAFKYSHLTHKALSFSNADLFNAPFPRNLTPALDGGLLYSYLSYIKYV